MNRKQIEHDIVMSYTANNYDEIKNIYIELVNERSKLDRWFNKYLDMFDDKMNSTNNKDPVWKLYNAKYDEYSKLNSLITTAEYYLKKP